MVCKFFFLDTRKGRKQLLRGGGRVFVLKWTLFPTIIFSWVTCKPVKPVFSGQFWEPRLQPSLIWHEGWTLDTSLILYFLHFITKPYWVNKALARTHHLFSVLICMGNVTSVTVWWIYCHDVTLQVYKSKICHWMPLPSCPKSPFQSEGKWSHW